MNILLPCFVLLAMLPRYLIDSISKLCLHYTIDRSDVTKDPEKSPQLYTSYIQYLLLQWLDRLGVQGKKRMTLKTLYPLPPHLQVSSYSTEFLRKLKSIQTLHPDHFSLKNTLLYCFGGL